MKESPTLIVLSRCSWTLHNFRRALIRSAESAGFLTIAAGGDGDGWGARLRAEGIDFRDIRVSRKGIDALGDIALILSLVRLFRRERPSVVHGFTIKLAIYGTIAAWIARVPVRIVTITGLGHAFLSGQRPLRRIVEGLYRVALARAHIVIFQNEDDRELFIARCLVAPDKTQLAAGSGVDLARFAATDLPVTKGAPVTVLMVARLLREKGLVEYVEAARIVRSVDPSIRFHLAGGIDPRNPSAFTEAEFEGLNADGVVQWLGEVDDVVPCIRAADIVVLPSYREGTSRSLLEAAAMGRALVTTDAPGCRQLVAKGDNGRLVPVGDARALAEAITDIVANPALLQEMGRRSRQMVEESYDERDVLRDTLCIYAIAGHGKCR